MKKNITIFVVGIFLIFIVGFFFSYKSYRIESLENQTITISAEEDLLSYHELKKELINNDGEYYLWFVDRNNPNTKYIKDQYITPFLKTLNVNEFEDLMIVDFTDSNFTKARMKSRYDLNDTTGFTKATVKDGKITFSDGLSFSDDGAFSEKTLEKWLYTHNIWQRTYKSLKNK